MVRANQTGGIQPRMTFGVPARALWLPMLWNIRAVSSTQGPPQQYAGTSAFGE